MNLKASLYDIFAYTIPGGLLLIIILHGLKTFEVIDYFTIFQNSSLLTLFIFGVSSHILGFLIAPITHIFAKNYQSKEKAYLTAFKEIVNRNPKLDTKDINPADWAIWFAKIKHENKEVANEIDQFLAYSKMMRGVCLALILSSLLLMIYTLTGKLSFSYLFNFPLLAILISLSILQAKKFKQGFYLLIFETALSQKSPFTIHIETKNKIS